MSPSRWWESRCFSAQVHVIPSRRVWHVGCNRKGNKQSSSTLTSLEVTQHLVKPL